MNEEQLRKAKEAANRRGLKHLHQGNAESLVGKKVDCTKNPRRFHSYPLLVTKGPNDERYMVKDTTGTCMYLAEESDLFNAVYYDTVLEEDAR